MLKYMIVHLDDTAVSFCHYANTKTERRLIPLGMLKESLFWSMKENLNVQFVYPDYELPEEYKAAIDSVDHADIVSSRCTDTALKASADVIVFDTLTAFSEAKLSQEQAAVVRITLSEFVERIETVVKALPSLARLNVVFTDVEKFTEEVEGKYAKTLKTLGEAVCIEYENGHSVQCNLLTDRIMLEKMNNCNAGDEHITLAPNGEFYICPAFYLDGKDGFSVGDIKKGLDIKNPQLYKLSHAPICRECDAYQCKRCVWLNRRMTLEVNTPSRQQCVMAHVERNASRDLLSSIRRIGQFMPEVEISEINYLDPFDKITKR